MEQLFEMPGGGAPESGSQGQTAYWQRVDTVAHDVVQILDEKEHWVIEGSQDFQAVLDELLDLVREHPRLSEFVSEQPESALKLMAYLHTSTAMMLMHVNAESRPAFVSAFLEVVTEVLQRNPKGQVGVAAGLAVDRFLAFERAGLVARIFSKERVDFAAWYRSARVLSFFDSDTMLKDHPKFRL